MIRSMVITQPPKKRGAKGAKVACCRDPTHVIVVISSITAGPWHKKLNSVTLSDMSWGSPEYSMKGCFGLSFLYLVFHDFGLFPP